LICISVCGGAGEFDGLHGALSERRYGHTRADTKKAMA